MLYFLIVFMIAGVIMAIVGFVGNKAVDGAENAIRARRVRQQAAQPRTQERLDARYQQKR